MRSILALMFVLALSACNQGANQAAKTSEESDGVPEIAAESKDILEQAKGVQKIVDDHADEQQKSVDEQTQ